MLKMAAKKSNTNLSITLALVKLMSIPQWPLLKVDVTPLDSTEERLAQTRKGLEQMKEGLE